MKTSQKTELTTEEYILRLNLENDRLKTHIKIMQNCGNCKHNTFENPMCNACFNLSCWELKIPKQFTQKNECDNCKDAESCKNCNSYYESCIGYEEETKGDTIEEMEE
jgi:hypothetical protein